MGGSASNSSIPALTAAQPPARARQVDAAKTVRPGAVAHGTDVPRDERVVSAEDVAFLGHELRTPLTALIGLCDVLLTNTYGSLTEKQTRCIEVMAASAAQMRALVEDALTVSAGRAGGLGLQLEQVPMGALLEETLFLLSTSARERELDVQLTVGPGPACVIGDPPRLKQVFVNLIANAIKFANQAGKVTVTVDSADGVVTVKVTNTGEGISSTDGLFRPFGRGGASANSTKLGLAVVKTLVELHDGEISFVSDPSAETTFIVRLPAARNALC